MDESLRSRVINAARTGKLTEEQTRIYLRLLDEDPDFLDDVKWEELLDDHIQVSSDEALYYAAAKMKFPEKEPVIRTLNYAIAAGIALFLISGWLVYQQFLKKQNEPVLAGSRTVELFSGDAAVEGQLGYVEGDLGIGERTWQLWEAKDQKEKISYQFCSDTLRLYFRQIEDTTAFNSDYRLTYLSKDESYYLVSKAKLALKLSPCTSQPQKLIE